MDLSDFQRRDEEVRKIVLSGDRQRAHDELVRDLISGLLATVVRIENLVERLDARVKLIEEVKDPDGCVIFHETVQVGGR